MMALLAGCVLPTGAPQVVEKSVETAEPVAPPEAPEAPEAAEAKPAAEPETETETQAITHAIEREQQIIVADAPWELVKQAELVPPEQAASLLLPAVSGFIEQGEFSAAQPLIEQLQFAPLSVFQRQSLRLLQAQLAQAQGRHSRAIGLLRLLRQSSNLSAHTEAKLLLLLADSQQTLRRNEQALATLLQRDRLPDVPGRAAGQQRILALIDSLDPLSRLLLREDPTDDAIDGWVALSEVLQSGLPEARDAGIQQWRALYREHPAEQLLLEQRLSAAATEYQHIAMLLPLTSPFGKAAQAFYEGFMASLNAAHPSQENGVAAHPKVSLHDIGDDPSLVSLYYQAALNDGADFIVGPLGRQAVNELLAGPAVELPTLLIGNVPEDKIAPNLYGISLSPEQEARQVAERAFSDGHRQTGILTGDSDWGRRVADAFAQQWESLGGTVVENQTFPQDISDHSRIIQKLLGLDKSIVRERILTAQLGINLHFTPRRRDDIDFLFLAANADEARLLAPQLRFFQAHDLALYATSYIYSGKPNPGSDADLDGIIFGDMGWVLDAAVLPAPLPEAAPDAPPAGEESSIETEPGASALADAQTDLPAETVIEFDIDVIETPTITPPPAPLPPLLRARKASPYYHTGLDRLYALGLESYRLIPRLEALRNNPWQRHYGTAVDISVNADGNAVRHLTWARFDRGLPVPLPRKTAVGVGLDVIPPPTPAPLQ